MPNKDEIRVRAYHLWEAKGCPADSALADWLEAERIAVERQKVMMKSVLALAQALGPKRLPPHVERAAEAGAAPAPVKKPATRSRKKVSIPV